MCSKNTIILANSSYLRSPKDFVFNTREKCECDAELDEPVELSVREVHKTFNVTMPKVTINWLNKTENIKKLLQKNTVKNFKIVFTSNHQAGRGEFLLQYKADRQIRLVCNQEVTHEIDLGTILIAPIAMIALLIIIGILFFIIEGIKRSRKQRLQVAEAHKKSTVTDLEADSRPDLLNYGSTVLDAKSDIPLKQSEEEGVPN
ncbi:uncharacterized protein LOC135497066 [Lineus longissimus]|uniref:uncharacterized protein LOC135497066 n=1 Tax=Lineus longissimus TaxID=88925 RepID=UPI002B4C4D5A